MAVDPKNSILKIASDSGAVRCGTAMQDKHAFRFFFGKVREENKDVPPFDLLAVVQSVFDQA